MMLQWEKFDFFTFKVSEIWENSESGDDDVGNAPVICLSRFSYLVSPGVNELFGQLV